MSIYIAVPEDTGTGQVSIAKADMLCWNGPNAMKEKTFHSPSWWASRGFANLAICGKGHDANHATCIPFTLTASGTPTRLQMRLRIMVTNSRMRTFRWALTSQRDDTKFLGRGPSKSSYVLSQGVFTAAKSNTTDWQTFDLWTSDIPAVGFLYLWRTSNSYGNIHVEGATLEVFVATSQTVWHQATPYVYDEGWQEATPKIYDNTWK